MTRLTEEEIKKAEQVSILNYIEQTGIGEVISSSQRWYKLNVNGHDSVVLDSLKNVFYHNGDISDKHASGNVINFIRHFEGRSFEEAVRLLLSKDFVAFDVKASEENLQKKKAEPFHYDSSLEVKATDKVRHYLQHVRKIDANIIDYLIEHDYLVQNRFGACVFKWKAAGLSDKPIVGASVQGTTYNPEKYGKRGTFKQVMENSHFAYGFNVTIGKPKDIYVFESTIDALSYWTLHPELIDFRLFAMEGLKNRVIDTIEFETTYEIYDIEQATIHLCADNDEAGMKFVENIMEREFRQTIVPVTAQVDLPSEPFKDYNEQLVSIREPKRQKPFIYYLGISAVNDNVRQFLVNERYIEAKLVDELLKRKIVIQDDMNQAVFLWRKGKEVVGGQVHSTEYNKQRFGKSGYFEGVMTNSSKSECFHLNFGKQPNRLLVFQNPIDLLSFYTLQRHKLKDLSTGITCMCLPPETQEVEVILQYIENHIVEGINHISLCFANNKETAMIMDKIKFLSKQKERAQFPQFYSSQVKVNINLPKVSGTWAEELQDTKVMYDRVAELESTYQINYERDLQQITPDIQQSIAP